MCVVAYSTLFCIQEVTELESCHTATQLPTLTATGSVSDSGDVSRTLGELLLAFHSII